MRMRVLTDVRGPLLPPVWRRALTLEVTYGTRGAVAPPVTLDPRRFPVCGPECGPSATTRSGWPNPGAYRAVSDAQYHQAGSSSRARSRGLCRSPLIRGLELQSPPLRRNACGGQLPNASSHSAAVSARSTLGSGTCCLERRGIDPWVPIHDGRHGAELCLRSQQGIRIRVPDVGGHVVRRTIWQTRFRAFRATSRRVRFQALEHYCSLSASPARGS